jgi:ABC-2 type transport system ATP-binding protein
LRSIERLPHKNLPQSANHEVLPAGAAASRDSASFFMIVLKGVTQHYGMRPVLQKVDLKIPSGRLTAIVGPNGMGKTTLLGVMAGILSPQQGFVEIDGLRRRRTEEEEIAIRRRVAYLPDHPWLPVNRTGREFLLGVGRLYDVGLDHLMDHVERLLELFQLAREGDWPIHSYSNGQKKKIAIASALVTETPVMLLDEPFAGGLDPAGILALRHVLRRLVSSPARTVVMTAPVPELVEELADEVVVLSAGQVAAHDNLAGLRRLAKCDGPLAEVLTRITHPQTIDTIERYCQETPA